MPTRNINLTDHYDDFISEQITSGRYRNVSEVMRAGLRLLEQQTQEDQHKLAVLRKLSAEGFKQLDQSQGIELVSPVQVEELVSQIGQRAAKRARRPSLEGATHLC